MLAEWLDEATHTGQPEHLEPRVPEAGHEQHPNVRAHDTKFERQGDPVLTDHLNIDDEQVEREPKRRPTSRAVRLLSSVMTTTPSRVRNRVMRERTDGAGKDYTKVTRDGLYHALTLLRFGRFDEILQLVEGRSENNEVTAGLWDFAQGYAHLRSGERDFAEVYLRRVLDVATTSDDTFSNHDASHLLGIVGGVLEGELHRDDGDHYAAIAAFERAVAIEDELTYDEPEPLPFSARH